MPITHAFVNPKGEPADATLIKPSNWNADHDYPAFTAHVMQFGDDPWTTQVVPAALNEIFPAHVGRTKFDLSKCLEARVVGNILVNTLAAAARLGVQYSVDQQNWNWIDAVNGPYIDMTPTGTKIGAWVVIAPAARADVWLRWVTINGLNDHIQWFQHYLQVR